MPNFSYALVVVDANSAQPKKGYVTNHIEAGQLYDGELDMYLCGPPPMVEAVNQYLRDQNIKPVSFHYEKFAASA
jgi:benzoate/toluate 1,2-dioxygenase reductase subunit